MPIPGLEVTEPDYNTPPPETVLGFPQTRHTFVHPDDGLTYFLGKGQKTRPNVMFVAPCPLEEELDSRYSGSMLLKGNPGILLDHAAKQAGVPLTDNYYTTLCKYCLPRKRKLKPTTQDIRRCEMLFERELKQRKPRIVVCLGKQVFDYFYNLRLQEREILGGWFRPPERSIKQTEEVPIFDENAEDGAEVETATRVLDEFECYRDFDLFVMRPVHIPAIKPEALDGQYFDLIEVANHLSYQQDSNFQRVETNYRLLRTQTEIVEWCMQMLGEQRKMFSVDCEWAGEDYLTGDLRSVQFCWAVGQAVAIEFFDRTGERFMNDGQRRGAIEMLQSVMNQPDVRFIGHNFSADYLWLKHWLGIDPYQRCAFDTMYAMHTVDETYDLKLERLSIRFTSVGRYDIPLIEWKKRNADLMQDGGYGAIPTEILFPYSCADVDVPFRAYPKLIQLLMLDETLAFYLNRKLPFVTDGFAHMTEAGMPLDATDAQDVRQQFTLASQLMLEVFKERVRETADNYLLGELQNRLGAEDGTTLFAALNGVTEMLGGEDAMDRLKTVFGAVDFPKHYEKILHWQDARNFNPNSAPQKIRWLFEFKGLRPIKSTKSDDGPSVGWDKVESLTTAQQRAYTPSTDKEVLQVYAQTDDDCQLLVEQLAVNQITKSFLKSADTGLESFIRSDGRVHSSFMCTETNRPRSISPNILNIPAYLSARVETGFKRAIALLQDRYGFDNIKEAYQAYLEDQSEELLAELPTEWKAPVPLRWCFKAPEDWCYVAADYATAEVWSIAYLSGDKNLVARLTTPDPQFVMVQGPDDTEPRAVRVAYVKGVTQFTEDQWDPELVTPLEQLEHVLRDEQGEPVRPKRDVHWEMAEHELFMNRPRERMSKKRERAAGKVGVFQIPYQSSPGLLNRLIELATGEKPEEDTGENLIQAYQESNPEVWEFLETNMDRVQTHGYYQCPSGAKRHFKTLEGTQVSRYSKGAVLGAQRRQASNYPMQGLVAQTLARSIVMLVDEFRQRGMQAQVCCGLYDAVYCVAPIAERATVQELMQKCMSDNNTWDLPGGQLKFGLDFEVTKRWSVSPNDEEKQVLGLI